jgi:hypothetical protein
MATVKTTPMALAALSTVRALATVLTGFWRLGRAWRVELRGNLPKSFNMNVYNEQYPEALAYMKSLVDAGVIDPTGRL